MITVGLDFGTHQSKVCIERKKERNKAMSFLCLRIKGTESSSLFPVYSV